jgi:hypothetical protein
MYIQYVQGLCQSSRLCPISISFHYKSSLDLILPESELLYDWRFTANQFVLAPSPLRLTARCFFFFNWTPDIISSLTRGWVCNLQLLLAFANEFILGSESRGTRDIFYSQIRDFPFCRLLRLAGLRWKYSTRPPHGKVQTWFWSERPLT